ncbi:hypothetical protein [Bradyrhizobium sp.]|uniref:hypothetical protein n=1 Tax=Bradyrhizobium sp. TaxID=376 RepID=UPI001EB27B5A|nr:hypothetical protein [Bradyrhizobium sp.]MBV9983732.1 SGNH/GDSL hydrolase family protein [Bradyrhizobium sp.]
MKSISGALVVFFNTLLLFAIVNVVVALYLSRTSENGKGQREQVVDLFIERHGIETLRAAYPGLPDPEIRNLLISTAVHGNKYHPYVEFIDTSYVSPEMLIRPEGYRVIGAEQAPWPPPKGEKGEKTVFLFGGSTALGTGALNHQTIAAYIQKLLRANFQQKINVYNFGTGAHYSTQEILFFFDWLRKGIIPDLAIFVDGLNEHAFPGDRSALSSFLEQDYEKILNSLPGQDAGDQVSAFEHLRLAFFKLPVVQLFLRQLGSEPTGALVAGVPEALRQGDFRNLTRPATAEETRLSTVVLDRFTRSMVSATGMANANGVQALFVWQPVPLYKHDLRLHPFDIQPSHQLHRVGYPLMYDRYRRGSLPANFAWCAEVQEGRSEMLYVDQVHYRPLLARLLAECTVRNLLSNHIVKELGWTRVSSEIVVPEMSERLSTPALRDNLVDLKEIVEQQPGRLFATNVAFEAKPNQQPDEFSIRLAASGLAAEHYFMISTELAEAGEYMLQMQIRPNNTAAVRIQAWDKDLEANGVLANVHFGNERVSTQTINRSEASLGQVERRDQWYDLAIGVRLPAGLSRLLIQLLGPNDNNVFAPGGQSLQIRNFAIRRGS